MSDLRHIELDVADLLKTLFGEAPKLVKDLHSDEQICGVCKGLGVHKWAIPFGVADDDPAKGLFPYAQEAIGPCPACYVGVQKVCGHCGVVYPKMRYQCDCAAALKERKDAAHTKEMERRVGCARIDYADYEGEVLFDADEGEYVYDGEDLDSDHTYFACKASSEYVHADADRIIEDLWEQANEAVEDGEQRVEVPEDARANLQSLLDEWMKREVTVEDTYWPDKDLIVVVKHAVVMGGSDEDPDDESSPPRQAT